MRWVEEGDTAHPIEGETTQLHGRNEPSMQGRATQRKRDIERNDTLPPKDNITGLMTLRYL